MRAVPAIVESSCDRVKFNEIDSKYSYSRAVYRSDGRYRRKGNNNITVSNLPRYVYVSPYLTAQPYSRSWQRMLDSFISGEPWYLAEASSQC